ncbi:MAG: hypothetical protein R3C14_03590 [Caldilineaceae bacterium]
MLTATTINLPNPLFDALDQVAQSETAIIQHHHQEITRLAPTQQGNWRAQMTMMPEILIPPAELMQPMDALWDE